MAVTSEILRQATDRSRVYCVPNGIPAAKAESVPLLDRQMKVAVVGRLEVEQKRCHWIPRVFEATLAHCPQASWDLIGDGGLEPWLKDFAAGASGLEVVGQMERGALGSYLRSVPRVLLMTSAYEGLSFVMLEALQSGCALVISSDPRATGLAIDSRHAVLVEMGASGVLRSSVARGIGEAIALALSGNQAIVARSRVGREIVQDELTAERMSLGFSQVLNSIADRPRRRRSGSHGIPRYSRRPGEALLSRITWGFERVRLRR
jgi:glycosyltransferase involved in cell wall biosynthesis